MTVSRWLTLLILSLLVSGCGVLEHFVAAPDDSTPVSTEPPALSMLRGDIAFAMDRGSFCWFTGERGICADALPPTYTADMHTLVIGTTLELLFAEPAPDTVTAALHPGSNLMTREADLVAEAVLDANGRVLVTVPANLDGNYVLTLFATWSDERAAHGDAAYYAPIRFEQ